MILMVLLLTMHGLRFVRWLSVLGAPRRDQPSQKDFTPRRSGWYVVQTSSVVEQAPDL
jgi:hypothetical protein